MLKIREMIFFNRKPACAENVDYIESMFDQFYQAYNRIDFNPKTKPMFESEDNEEFINYLLSISKDLDLTKVEFDFDEEDHLKDDLPAVFTVNEEPIEYCSIHFTSFSAHNKQIAIFETLLYLIYIKTSRESFLGYTEEVFENKKYSFHPMLVSLGLYFGFGDFLLTRNFVKGTYIDEYNHEYNITFYVPLDLNTMIYGYSVLYAIKHNNGEKLQFKSDIPYTSEIRKEIEICLKYIEKGNSPFFEKTKSINFTL